MLRRIPAVALAMVSVVALARCGGDKARTVRPPTNAPSDARWYNYPAPNHADVLLGVVGRPAGDEAPRPAIVLVPGTEGLNVDYVAFARELATNGFTVVVGCWFANAPRQPDSPVIGCAGAPTFKGVTDQAVGDLNALVDGAKDVLGTDQRALVGFSRGGGIVMLRAATGASEPVVSIAGLLEAQTPLGTVPGEVNVVERASMIHAPVLLLHGETDGAVPVEQARHMEAALRAHGDNVEAKYYPNEGHGLAQVPDIRRDLIRQISRFVCEHLTCAANASTS